MKTPPPDRHRWILAAAVLAAAALTACGEPSQPEARAAGRFRTCVPCHGQDGAGNPVLQAPPIAGLPAWYVDTQLHNFQHGLRGTHPEDLAGMRMQPMARTLPSDRDVAEIADYVSKLPPTAVQPLAMGGDIARGQALFNGTCIACHGFDGGGNAALKAPAIAGHPDWYLYTQLHNFKVGARGARPEDATGSLMRPMAMTLDDQGMKDVAAYAWSLSRK
jgi:cytochrome c553